MATERKKINKKSAIFVNIYDVISGCSSRAKKNSMKIKTTQEEERKFS